MSTKQMDIFEFIVIKGHRVASGLANDPRFPLGTIKAQTAHFKKLGLNISQFYPATINAKFIGESVTLNQYEYFFKQVNWHSEMPAEDFKFFRCTIIKETKEFPALIYQPQVDTKTEHLQPKIQLEILAPYIENIIYGDLLKLKVTKQAIILTR